MSCMIIAISSRGARALPALRLSPGMSQDEFVAPGDRSVLLRSHFAAAVATVLEADDSVGGARPPASTAFAAQLTEVAWTWATTALAPDIEAFARHSKRTKIGPEDVVLAARKNEATHGLLGREAARLRSVRPRKGETTTAAQS